MVTDTLQEYDALLETGFSEEQARALVQLVSPTRTDPEVLNLLNQFQTQFDQINQRFDQINQRFDQVDQRFDQVDQRFGQVDQRFDQVDQRLDSQAQMLAQHSQILAGHGRALEAAMREIGILSHDVGELKQEVKQNNVELVSLHQQQAETRADLHVVEERVKMEGRVSRMINATLIALGAIAASMAAVFAR